MLVFEGKEPVKGETFYRPLGGGIEFGESSETTVQRELQEELNMDVDRLPFLGVLENIFTFNGNSYHEIVMVFDGALVDSGLYAQAEIHGKEANGDDIRALWKSLVEFAFGKSILYPDGLPSLLRTEIH
ncbi:MAG TPA: NUDIX domain-containing protein [Anaerolineales bacterium]|nr:NUDIX domain-containing protein [Anaerolineales bacterium]